MCNGIDGESHGDGKQQLKRIVSALTKLTARPENVAEPATEFQADAEYEYEYRFAEYKYEECAEPELSRAPEPGLRPSSSE